MQKFVSQKPISVAIPSSIRLWVLPFLTIGLIAFNTLWSGMDSIQITMFASLAIILAGIPHGTLDIEIAAARFGHASLFRKLAILAAYVGCVLLMIFLWRRQPEIALSVFLVIAIMHFSADWRGGVDPFLAMMVGWALVALPALSHPESVAIIFEILTGNENGATIAAILACASVPAGLGSLAFVYWAYQRGDMVSAIDVLSCIIAALCLPPLIAFALFFCGLHSPRHMADALRDTGALSPLKKAVIIAAVFGLASAIGVILFITQEASVGAASVRAAPIDSGIIQMAFVLLSTLTAPHFLLEQFMALNRPNPEISSP